MQEASGGYPPLILVVDDEPAISALISLVLSGEGYRTQVASGGEEAITLLTQSPPDAVLLDIMMPGVDGWQVCRFMRNDPQLAGVPIAIVTALHSPGAGCAYDELITKPFALEQVIGTVERLLERPGIPHS